MKDLDYIIDRISKEREVPRELVKETIGRFHTMMTDKMKEAKYSIKCIRFCQFDLIQKVKPDESKQL